ncbi:hypothetical protein [Streptomyces virginiae]|uniref:hypothetical protein n=1 Tax=Streptomyces virginiae TaxID=1961 RepID=UPI003799EA55
MAVLDAADTVCCTPFLLKATTDGPNPISLAFTGMNNPVQMGPLPGVDSASILLSQPASGVSQGDM